MKYSYFIPIYIIFTLYLIISRVKKIKREDRAIAIALRECDYIILFSGFGWLLLAVISFSWFREDFKQANWLLVPKYISNWRKLFFNYDYLTNLANMFDNNNKLYSEASTLNAYIGVGLNEFYNGITQALVGVNWLIGSFDNVSICKEGIYTKDGHYKWKNIRSYEWGKFESKQRRQEHLEYYSLEIEVHRPIIKKVFRYDEFKEINMKISAEDKKKVEEFLKENLQEDCIQMQ
ncbi:hypothetical protein OW763_14430 [Clostridium aestuarii]|uniref:SMODS-associating 2TM beta-strand rich effector domain-containing protein n=1 Tax=Clostridium aestuarii TaxID=338193 RepID=A0ABT4D6A4_9CLOT|nr:hypothetical protein [Clostridium aestuarii]MCY6485528.1 hypothetical protein [Clostridium aestuarii]